MRHFGGGGGRKGMQEDQGAQSDCDKEEGVSRQVGEGGGEGL